MNWCLIGMLLFSSSFALAQNKSAENSSAKAELTKKQKEEMDEAIEERQKKFAYLLSLLKSYSYNPSEKRDPFEKWRVNQPKTSTNELEEENPKENTREEGSEPLEPLEQWDVDELLLLGVTWGDENPTAIIKDPLGTVHIVRKNAKLGVNDGYIAVIREGEVVVVEAFKSDDTVSYQSKTLKVRR